MRKLLLIIGCFLSLTVSAQFVGKLHGTIQNATTPFLQTIPAGSTVFDLTTHITYNCITGATAEETLTTASAKFKTHTAALKDSTDFIMSRDSSATLGKKYATGKMLADGLAGKAAIADISTMLSEYSRIQSPTFTGVPAAPTAAVGTNTTQLATTAFVQAATPVDFVIQSDPWPYTTPGNNTLFYYGALSPFGFETVVDKKTILIPFNCTFVGFSLTTRSTAACSAETGTLSLRINNTTDVQLSNAVTWGVGGAYIPNHFSGTGFTTSLSAGDKIELKLLTPTWATNATSIVMSTILYFKNR